MRTKVNLSIMACLVLLALVIAPLQFAWAAEPPLTQWDKTFGGTSNDYADSVQQTTDGGYVLAGITVSSGAGGEDAWLIKTDSEGNKTWDKTFGGTSNDVARSVQQTADGGYVLVGYTGGNAWLIKTDSEGNKAWDKTFGGTGFNEANSVQQTADGGYVLAGYTDSYGAGDGDAWLIKTDSSGNKTWDRTFGGTRYDAAYSVQLTADGGYVLAGYTGSSGAGGQDAWLIKTDSSGNKTWDRTFGGTALDIAFSVQQTADGGYVLAGATQTPSTGHGDAWLIKTDSEGNKTWDKTFGGTNEDEARSVQQTADVGYVLAGRTMSSDDGGLDAWLIKTDSEGNKTWDKTFGGTSEDEAHSVQQTADGGYVLAGYTGSYGAGSYDAWLIKVASASEALAPTVTSITPNTAATGLWPVNVTLAGTGFQTGASVRLELGGTVVNATNVKVVSDTKITCQLALPGTLVKYDVVVKNPDGQEARLTNGFSVTNICGQSAGSVAVAFGLMMGLLSLGGSGLLRRRRGRKSR